MILASCLTCSTRGALLAATLTLGVGVMVPASAAEPVALPRPDHIVVVVMENHDFSEIIGSPKAPFINDLGRRGATFTMSFAVTHPSQPNYFALFTGSTQGVESNDTYLLDAPTLAGSLERAGRSFVGYAEH